MKIRVHLINLLLVTAWSMASAADDVKVDGAGETAGKWTCEYCAFEKGMHTIVEGGLGYVSDDSFRFGRYNGLQERGLFPIGNAQSHYRNYENANYWDISAADLGLESRSVQVQGGKQGRYKASFLYQELPNYLSDTARTPFIDTGNRLILDSAWVKAGSTGGMTALAGQLHDIDLQTKRTRIGAGAAYLPTPQWQTSVNYRHETREGKQQVAGSFYFNAAQFAQPVDYTTDLIDIGVSYTGQRWQAKLAYQGSTFSNSNDSLIWQNPYTPLVAGADQGELAQPPDNQFHQARASLAVRLGSMSKFMADVALGRMTQNESYSAVTTNVNLSPAPLPATSLDGRVDTINTNITLNSQLTEKFTVNAVYRYSDRDNQSPQRSYDWVITDVNVATPRTNLPYSYTRDTFKVQGDYRLESNSKTSLGYDFEQYQRSYQEVEQSKERNLWASLNSHTLDTTSLSLRIDHASRGKNGYQVITGVDSPENPLMRKYNMADRDRDALRMRMDFVATLQSTIGLSVDLTNDDYPDSAIGLTASRASTLGFDFSSRLAPSTLVNFYLSFEKITSKVVGSQLYDLPDWSGAMSDKFNTAGLGFNHTLYKDKLDVGMDYVFSHSLSGITIDQGGPGSPLPDLVTTLYSVKFYANYRLSDKLDLRGSYWYEYFTASDWALDGVGEATIANTLTLGQESPSYNVNVLLLSLRYDMR